MPEVFATPAAPAGASSAAEQAGALAGTPLAASRQAVAE
jgi:hypothetical protein